MKNVIKANKGFTLTELLATIVILAVVVLIATPAVIGVSNSIKKNQYEAKVKLLLQAAKLYGEDKGTANTITIQNLIDDNYITCDDKAPTGVCVANPKNNKDMKDCGITININTTSGRVSTSWATTNTSEACKRD